MSGKHSPGPWTWSRLDDYCELTDANDKKIVTESTDGTGVKVNEADERLIAAAPEMLPLPLLREALAWLDDPSAYATAGRSHRGRVSALLARIDRRE